MSVAPLRLNICHKWGSNVDKTRSVRFYLIALLSKFKKSSDRTSFYFRKTGMFLTCAYRSIRLHELVFLFILVYCPPKEPWTIANSHIQFILATTLRHIFFFHLFFPVMYQCYQERTTNVVAKNKPPTFSSAYIC